MKDLDTESMVKMLQPLLGRLAACRLSENGVSMTEDMWNEIEKDMADSLRETLCRFVLEEGK